MIELNDENFEQEALNSDKLVVVDLWAPWCGPCVALSPILEEISNEADGEKVSVVKLNVDNNPKTANKYKIRSIPTILYLRNGEVLDRSIGLPSKESILSKIESYNRPLS
jgi:thioredoxin 1